MKQKKLFYILFTLFIGISLILSACAPEPAPEESEAEEAVEEPVEVEEAEEEEEVAEEALHCSDPADFELDPTIAEHVANGDKLVIPVSYHDVSNEFAPFIKAGVDQAAAEFGVDAFLVGPVSADAEAQINELETLIEKGVDGLAISSASTDALAPFINRVLDMGIPVVTFNSPNPGANDLAYFGQDMVLAGYTAAKELAERMSGEGNVLITTLDAGAQWSLDREEGARNAFAEYPGINVQATINCGTEPQEIYSNIENAMLTYPDTNGIVALECCTHAPAGMYLKRNDLVGEVMIIGFDLIPDTLQLIKEGVEEATFDAAPARQSYEAVKQLINFLNGEEICDFDTGLQVVDASNIDQYMGEEYLFQSIEVLYMISI